MAYMFRSIANTFCGILFCFFSNLDLPFMAVKGFYVVDVVHSSGDHFNLLRHTQKQKHFFLVRKGLEILPLVRVKNSFVSLYWLGCLQQSLCIRVDTNMTPHGTPKLKR